MKTHILLLFLLISFLQVHAQDTYLNVVSTDGTESQVSLTDIRNLTFSNADNFYVNLLTGVSDSFQYTSVRKLVFTTTSGLHEEVDAKNLISIYPNPAKSFINLKNLDGKEMNVVIYSVAGIQVANLKNVSEGQSIDVSFLPNGVYFVKVNNQTFKLLKR